ncbi:MAG: hypothetical protein Q8S00_26345 [Deltaproteobacteria bacterium]|nr:hypothetical protein [Deltaproteobacteria bacterium]MDZ4347463.1 hypothetical protein [Candidatus Binatia bacterium]
MKAHDESFGKTFRPDRKPFFLLFKRFVEQVSVTCLLSGCMLSMPLTPTTEGLPGVGRLPLTVGISYGPELRDFKHVEARIFPVGEASIALFDQVFPLLFERTIELRNSSNPERINVVAAILEPTIEAFELRSPTSWPSLYWSEVIYRFTLWSPKREMIASWTIMGVGMKEAGLFFPLPSQRAVVEFAMQDAARKFLITFRGLPEVRQMLRDSGSHISPVEPPGFSVARGD